MAHQNTKPFSGLWVTHSGEGNNHPSNHSWTHPENQVLIKLYYKTNKNIHVYGIYRDSNYQRSLFHMRGKIVELVSNATVCTVHVIICGIGKISCMWVVSRADSTTAL